VHAIDQRTAPERIRREPFAPIPSANLFTDVAFGDLEGEQALRTDRRLDFLIIDERWRAAEIAVLRDTLGIEDGHCLAALALHGAFRRVPPSSFVGQLAKRLRQVELDDRAGCRVDAKRGRRAAKGTNEKLP
jgi:hypothetical protein